jgi:trigger factor
MIEDQLTTMMQNFDQDLHRHNMELGLYLAKINKTQEDLKKEWRPEAERQVKMALILHAIAREYDIRVTPAEADEALETLVQSTMLRDGSTPQNLDMERMRTALASRLLNEKTFEFLEKTCIA